MIQLCGLSATFLLTRGDPMIKESDSLLLIRLFWTVCCWRRNCVCFCWRSSLNIQSMLSLVLAEHSTKPISQSMFIIVSANSFLTILLSFKSAIDSCKEVITNVFSDLVNSVDFARLNVFDYPNIGSIGSIGYCKVTNWIWLSEPTYIM